jgi:uncharacterized phage protein gp47/JayE
MNLQLPSFGTLVQNMAAVVQGAAPGLVDLTVGSILRATLEASASIGLWMQWLVLLLLQTTRAATSAGPDLDSWMGDFSLSRLPASAAVGTVTFTRFTPVQAALIPVGALVRTADGTQSFVVTANSSSTVFSASQNGYVVAAGTASLDVPVVAQTPGSAGNVLSGTISLLASAVPGVDTVTNAAPTQGGLDAETDTAFRSRFQAYINSRSLATKSAIGYAIASIQQNLNYTIQENVDPTGTPSPGSFVVTVDDGSGSPSANLLTAVASAIDAVRPVGSIYAVQPPAVLLATVSLSIAVNPGAVNAQVVGAVTTAITAWIDALPIGAGLPLSRLAQLAFDASTAVGNASQITINGAAADLPGGAAQVIRAGTVAVN